MKKIVTCPPLPSPILPPQQPSPSPILPPDMDTVMDIMDNGVTPGFVCGTYPAKHLKTYVLILRTQRVSICMHHKGPIVITFSDPTNDGLNVTFFISGYDKEQ